MPAPARRCLILCLLLLVGGCGFSLRGGSELPDSFSRLQLSLQQPNSEFSRLLRRGLQAADVTIIEGDAAQTADIPHLTVHRESLSNRPVTVNPRARAAQNEIRVAVEVSLEVMGSVLLASQTLSVQRSYFEDIENIVGSQEEVEILTTEMRRELVNLLMRRLQAAARTL